MIRYHLDENVDHAVAHGLRLREIDVTTTTDAGLVGATDLEQLVYARSTGRVVFTQDQDFLRLHASDEPHAGIVYAKKGARGVGDVVRFLVLLSDCLEPGDMRGQLEFL